MMVRQAERYVMLCQKRVDVVVVPAGVAKFESVAPLRREHGKEIGKPGAICSKARRQLKQNRAALPAKQRQSRFHELKGVGGARTQPLPMRDEFGRLPGEQEIRWRLVAPAFDRL